MLNYYKLAELSPQYYAIEQGELKVKNSDNSDWSLVPEYGTLAAGIYTVSGNNVEIRDASKNTVIATCIGDTFSKFTLNENTAIKMKVGYGLDKYPAIMKAMLNKGDSKKPYEPYTGGKPSPSVEYPQEITSCGENGNVKIDVTGKNLLNIEGEISEIRGDYEIFDNKITTITKDNYSGSYLMFSEKIPKGKYRFTCNKTKKGVKQNNRLLISTEPKIEEKNTSKNFNSYYKKWLIVEYLKKDILFETFEDFQIGLPLAGDDDKIGDEIIFENVMLMREDLDLTSVYEPYKKIQTLIIQIPNGLPGLKVEKEGNYTDETGQQWICDEIDLARGKYVQRIRKIALDGNIDIEHVGQYENGTKYLGITLQEKDYTLRASNMLCTRYIRSEWTNENGYVYSAKKDTIIITDNRFTDLETTKKIIGEEKPVIIYPLLTPIETDLPPETIATFKKLHTNYPNTIIINNADAGMELTYTVDTQSYIDGKIAEVSKAIL